MESKSYSLGILPKQSTLVNTMLLLNEYLILFALRAHFSCKISSFSSLCVLNFTVQVITFLQLMDWLL